MAGENERKRVPACYRIYVHVWQRMPPHTRTCKCQHSDNRGKSHMIITVPIY